MALGHGFECKASNGLMVMAESDEYAHLCAVKHKFASQKKFEADSKKDVLSICSFNCASKGHTKKLALLIDLDKVAFGIQICEVLIKD